MWCVTRIVAVLDELSIMVHAHVKWLVGCPDCNHVYSPTFDHEKVEMCDIDLPQTDRVPVSHVNSSVIVNLICGPDKNKTKRLIATTGFSAIKTLLAKDESGFSFFPFSHSFLGSLFNFIFIIYFLTISFIHDQLFKKMKLILSKLHRYLGIGVKPT